ncbi:MAG: cell wall hydrolase [Proteobacteria bacterium]|nr:cell wall hydrolase [Pseudomonadota bacterium]
MLRYSLNTLWNEIKARCWHIWSWPDDIRVHVRYLWYTSNKARLVFILLPVLIIASLSTWRAINSNALQRDIGCLALNVYHEARGESARGQHAVAQVTMNRVASRHYPNTICEVVYQQNWDRIRKRMVGAFSWTELDHRSRPKGRAWHLAQVIAHDTYYQRTDDLVKGSLFYHAKYIKPRWARNKKPVALIGKHIFYQ